MTKIVHIVLWRLKPTSDLVSVKAGFQKLLAVPGPLKGHLGETQISERAKGFDYGFYSVFDSMDSLKQYAVSDAHMKVVIENIRPHTEDVLAYDMEIDD